MSFELITHSKTMLVFQLLPTAKTLKCFPFKFALNIIYQLDENCLKIGHEVQNNGEKTMPFSIGAHPGFTLPGPIDECFLEFEKAESLSARLLGQQGLLSPKTLPVLKDSNLLPLSRALFDRDALIFLDTKSKKITLGTKNSSRRLPVEFVGFPDLGIWAKPGAPFVCIEPWYGDIWNKPGILLLDAGKSFTCEHRIIIEA
jgi:galactose mutarotase-like enzyme